MHSVIEPSWPTISVWRESRRPSAAPRLLAGDRQVEGARIGLTQNMGGSGASCVIHIMEGVS